MTKFNDISGTTLQLFAPTYVAKEEVRGEVRLRTINLTFHYIFVRGALREVKQLCSATNGFSFLLDRGNEDRYAVIDDAEMVHFMNIARAYRNCLPYYSLEDIDLEDGDMVEVINGDFPGLVGTYMPNPKSKTGNIVLKVFNNVGTIAFNVKASDVRVLEFSTKFTRANDQIDAFIPQLLKALRHYDSDEALTPALAAKLFVFCGRMEVVRINNRKLNARLQLLLYAANHIIGNTKASENAMERYERLHENVTNEWTMAAHRLILSILSRDFEALEFSYSKIVTLEPASKAQRMIVDEYDYYIAKLKTFNGGYCYDPKSSGKPLKYSKSSQLSGS